MSQLAKKISLICIGVFFFIFLGLWLEIVINLCMGIYLVYSIIFRIPVKLWVHYTNLLLGVIIQGSLIYFGFMLAIEYHPLTLIKDKGLLEYLQATILLLVSLKGVIYSIVTGSAIAIQITIIDKMDKNIVRS